MTTKVLIIRAPEPTVRVTLKLHPFYEAAVAALREQSVENFKEFCRRLRLSKLLWYHYDRQEPEAFDYGGEQLMEFGEKVLAAVEALAEGKTDSQLGSVRRALREDHLDEIRERLDATPVGRVEIDRVRLNSREHRPITPVLWSSEPVPVPA